MTEFLRRVNEIKEITITEEKFFKTHFSNFQERYENKEFWNDHYLGIYKNSWVFVFNN